MPPNKVSPPKLSKARFEHITREQAKVFGQDEGFRNAATALAGSEEKARAFFQPRGVGIGAFAKMVNLPVSTVRHYVRLGLIEPWDVEGRYRFQPLNVRQAETVRMWGELEMSLEEIIQRKQRQRQADPELMLKDLIHEVPHAGGRTGALGVAFVRQKVKDKELHLHTSIWSGNHLPDPSRQTVEEAMRLREIMQELLEEYRAVRERLEGKKREIEGRIARVRKIENELSGGSDETLGSARGVPGRGRRGAAAPD